MCLFSPCGRFSTGFSTWSWWWLKATEGSPPFLYPARPSSPRVTRPSILCGKQLCFDQMTKPTVEPSKFECGIQQFCRQLNRVKKLKYFNSFHGFSTKLVLYFDSTRLQRMKESWDTHYSIRCLMCDWRKIIILCSLVGARSEDLYLWEIQCGSILNLKMRCFVKKMWHLSQWEEKSMLH